MAKASNRSNVGVWLRRLVMWPLLAVFALHTLMTGSPIPLWHIERLQSPTAVKEIRANELVLEDGRHTRLPLIVSLPQGNVLFQAAIKDGVEVRDDGEVFGLLWVDRSCGHDPYVWRKYRINLSELSAALEPKGIDSSIVHPEAIQFLADAHQIKPRPSHPDRLDDYSAAQLRQIRRQFEYSLAQRNRVEPELGYSIPLSPE